MKITEVKPYLFFPGGDKNVLLCRVDTDEGIYGWGEAYVVMGNEAPVVSYIETIGRYMAGRSPFNIRHSGTALFDDLAIRRGGMEFYAAWSSIEIALWDIVGKKAGRPVYDLLGGACRKKIRVYANGWFGPGGSSIEDTARKAKEVIGMGFTALKWDPFGTRWRSYISKKQEDYAVECVKAVREAVGPKVNLLIEVHRRLSPFHASHFAERIMKYDPFWFEEPCLADNINLVVEAKKNIRIPVVTGETLYTKSDFVDVLEKRAADIVNPDICICNGILGITQIAAMCEPYNILVSPHNYNSMSIGLAATVHASAVMNNFLITEYFVNHKPGCDAISPKPIKVENGFIELPTEPGLGIDINIAELEKKPHRIFESTFSKDRVADYTEEFPREEDYN
jgi:galactonate dehydratase